MSGTGTVSTNGPIQDSDIDLENDFQYADLLSKEASSLIQLEQEEDSEDDDDRPLLSSDNTNEHDRGDVELKIPLRLQRKGSIKKRQTLYRPYFTIFISIVDVVVMILELVINKGFEKLKVNPWLGVSLDTLIKMGGKDTALITSVNPQWWRLITPVFLHVGLGHLALNLVAQILLGIQLERVLGTPRIIVLYFISAVAGNLMSALFLPFELEVGASTAIYGLGSYYLVDLLVHWSLIIAPGKYLIGLAIGSVVGLLFGLLPGIDNFAHIGGSAGGFIVSLVLVPRTKEGRSLRYAKLATYMGPPLLLIYFAGGLAVLYTPILRAVVWQCHWCEYLNCLPIFHWCA